MAANFTGGTRASYRGNYRQLIELLDRITDQVGEDENHPLASPMDVLGVLIEKYEDEQVPELTE
jgi:HTH-type transcriptional regulator/antitoxin HigA